MIKVNIYYGGRGLIEDPANYVMNKLIQVLEELNIQVKKYNLYEDIRGISVLPKTLKNTDAVILVASIEWLGIGGLLQQFLDSCWLYGDKETLKRLYMMPVAISTTYGEKEAYTTLIKAWELLGGKPCDGISAYVNNTVDFETNSNYAYLIEKKAENFYRTFSKKIISFPSSTNAVLDNVAQPKSMNLILILRIIAQISCRQMLNRMYLRRIHYRLLIRRRHTQVKGRNNAVPYRI